MRNPATVQVPARRSTCPKASRRAADDLGFEFALALFVAKKDCDAVDLVATFF